MSKLNLCFANHLTDKASLFILYYKTDFRVTLLFHSVIFYGTYYLIDKISMTIFLTVLKIWVHWVCGKLRNNNNAIPIVKQ